MVFSASLTETKRLVSGSTFSLTLGHHVSPRFEEFDTTTAFQSQLQLLCNVDNCNSNVLPWACTPLRVTLMEPQYVSMVQF